MEKTYSQKYARIMEIGSSIMMIPAAFGVFMTGFLWLMMIGSALDGRGNLPNLSFPLIPTAAIIWGIWLLVYYFKHSRGKLAEERIKNMWISTLVFNVLLSFGSIYSFSGLFISLRFQSADEMVMLLLSFFLAIWHITSITLAIKALNSLKRTDNAR
jgi:hypothetical protein